MGVDRKMGISRRWSTDIVSRRWSSETVSCLEEDQLRYLRTVTDEQNTLSLCPDRDPTNLDDTRIRCLSVWGLQPHMYPRISSPSDVSSDMYVKEVVLWHTRQWGTMVDVFQVMITVIITITDYGNTHTIIFKIHVSRLTTLVCVSTRLITP